jgi:6-phosphofructokinase 1
MAKRVAVLTSGGDAPGMNGAIRAVVRSGIARGWSVYGVRRGFAGLVAGEFDELGARDVGGILQKGGTVLGSARCPEFREEATRREAVAKLAERGIDALVVIGGNGSQTGAHALSRMGLDVVGIASTIDNDLVGSDVTIGVDTALNIALESIDRLKTTASSLRRAFLVEVMGRDSGYLALMAGITGGAEVVVVPEFPITADAIAEELQQAYERGKPHAIAVVAEGSHHAVEELARRFSGDGVGFEVRATILGHVQRGGAPGAFDRALGTRLGAAAIDCLAEKRTGVVVGLDGSRIGTTPLGDVVGVTKPLDPALVELARVLAR